MGTRGRKSKADLAVVSTVKTVERVNPPGDLNAEQKAEWMKIVNAHPADRFRPEHVPMLAGYCRHTVAQKHVNSLIADLEGGDEFDVVAYDRLLKMQDREDRCLSSLAVRLGFAYSTAYEKRPAKGGKSARKPWEVDA